MNQWILIGGLALMLGIAILVGERSAQSRAWRAIASERRALYDARRALDDLADDLMEEGQRLQEWESRLAVKSERTISRHDS